MRRARAKVVLVGNDRQLAEIDAGGAFRAIAARLPAIELTENRRQEAAWEREALERLRDGSVPEALAEYEGHGRVVTGETAEEVRSRLVDDWWAGLDPDGDVMIALRRSDVRDLNRRARALMREHGALGEEELQLAGGAFAVGDRVVLRSNDRRLGVANGDRGEILAIDPAARRLDVLVGDRHIRLERDYLDRDGATLRHGYAITGHSAQGLTCGRAFVLITDEASRQWAYTALSRGRESNRLYAVAPEAPERAEYAPHRDRSDASEALLEALGRSSAKTLASDHWDQPVLRRARSRDRGLER